MIKPNTGEIYSCDLNPVLGTEQAGRRPVIIISSTLLHNNSKRIFICPITSNIIPHPMKFILPHDYKTKGAVLLDQTRAIDWQERGMRYIEQIDSKVILQIQFFISSLIFNFPENQMRDFILQQIKETT